MSWLDIKQKARGDVNRTFAIPAQFRPQSGGAIDGTARLHYKVRSFGDLDREGFATVTEDIDYIILDTRVFIGAAERDKVHFPDLNRTFKLDVEHPNEDGIFVKWEVIEDSVP